MFGKRAFAMVFVMLLVVLVRIAVGVSGAVLVLVAGAAAIRGIDSLLSGVRVRIVPARGSAGGQHCDDAGAGG